MTSLQIFEFQMWLNNCWSYVVGLVTPGGYVDETRWSSFLLLPYPTVFLHPYFPVGTATNLSFSVILVRQALHLTHNDLEPHWLSRLYPSVLPLRWPSSRCEECEWEDNVCFRQFLCTEFQDKSRYSAESVCGIWAEILQKGTILESTFCGW